jgi:hypothetical protein
VPANRCAWWVVEKECVLKRSRGQAGEAGSTFTDEQKKVRQVPGLPQAVAIEVIVPTKGDDSAFAKEAVKLEFLEWKRWKHIEQGFLFLSGEDVGRVPHAIRQCRSDFKQISLF